MTKIPEHDDEHHLFKQHMAGVKPLKKTKTVLKPKEKKDPCILPQKTISTSAEETSSTVISSQIIEKNLKKRSFTPKVDINVDFLDEPPITSQSILSFGLEKLSQSQQDRVKKGQIQLDARIDLHGLERFDAQDHLQRFIHHARSHHNRYLLIIHGKGSKHGETPILKQHLFYWLRLNPLVLTLYSAHPKHGGTGALYVILKKTKLETA
jgi:DNA-nicking Smr family endonuclease